MNANIGSLLRAMMGEVQPSESARALELRIGQIVRGVLVEMLDDGEAVLNVNGVKVRARLEAELPVGRGTLLQVQPESQSGLIVLKPLAEAPEAAPNETVRGALKSFGLPDAKWAEDLVRGLKRDGYALDKETAAWFRQALEAKPAGAGAKEWANAAAVAFRRGLAPTEATIASLRQALFGPPLHAQLAAFETQLAAFAAAAKPGSGQAEAAGRLLGLLAEGAALLSEGARRTAEDAIAQLPRQQAGPAEAAAQGAGPSAAERPAASGSGAVQAPLSAAAVAPEAQPAAGQKAMPQQPIPTVSGCGARAQAAPGAGTVAGAPGPVPASGASAGEEPQRTAYPEARDAGAAGKPGREAAALAARPFAARPEASEPWIGRFLQWLGVGHERQVLLQPDAGPAAAAFGTERSEESGGQDAAKAQETLKGALLALAGRDDVPAPLREAASSLAQQIAGQQLLLSPERQNTGMLSHMVFFVPLKGEDGDTTATIHVQTRRGRRGEWDADNCRLLFDLKMKHLGETLVDVSVVNKMVSLKIWNDRPWVADLIESARDEAQERLLSAGYQLLSLKSASLPKPAQGDGEPASAEAFRRPGAADAPAPDAFAAKLYRGVDFRA